MSSKPRRMANEQRIERHEAIIRDGQRCTVCGSRGRLEVELLDEAGPYERDNLTTFCTRCRLQRRAAS